MEMARYKRRLLTVLTLSSTLYIAHSQHSKLPFVMYPLLKLADSEVSETTSTNVCKCKHICWWKASCSSFTYFPNTETCTFSNSTNATHSMFVPAEGVYSFIKNNFSSGLRFRGGQRAFLYVDAKETFDKAERYCPQGGRLASLGDSGTYNAVRDYLKTNNLAASNIWVNGAYNGSHWLWLDGTLLSSRVGDYPWGGNFPFDDSSVRNKTWISPTQNYYLVNQTPDKKTVILCELPAV